MSKKLQFISHCLLILLMLFPSVQAKVYKWVDKNGKVHYSDKPFNEQSQEIEIKSDISPEKQRAAQARANQLIQQQNRLLTEQRETQAEHLKKQKQENAKKKKLNIACINAKESLRVLKMQRPVYHVDDKGERQFISDEKRKEGIAELNANIARHCNQDE